MTGTRTLRAVVIETIPNAINIAMCELQSLRDEVTEAAEALEEKFSGTSRYERLRDTADALDQFCDDEPDVPDCVQAMTVSYRELPRKATRPDRRDWACAIIATVKDDLDEWIGKPENDRPQIDDVQELSDTLDNIQGEAEALDFPGMYG